MACGLELPQLAPRPEPKMGAGGAAATAAGASGSADDVPAAPATPVTAAAAPGNQHFVLRTALPTVLRLQVRAPTHCDCILDLAQVLSVSDVDVMGCLGARHAFVSPCP